MKKRLILLVFIALVLSAQGVFAQVVDRVTPQQIFDRCGVVCDPSVVATTGKGGIHATATESDVPFAILRVIGGQIIGTSGKVYMDIVRDLPDVWVAGRVLYTTDTRPVVPEKAFYVGRDISLTRYGPGLFLGLLAGAVIPIGEVFVGNAGEEANLQVVFYDNKTGHPVGMISTRLWSRVKSTRGVPSLVQVNSVEVLADGATLRLTGRFPKGERLVVEVGDPEWDSNFTTVIPDSDKAILVRIPQGKTGAPLYPNNWDGESVWTIVVATTNGESFTFPWALRVRGDFNRTGIFPAQ